MARRPWLIATLALGLLVAPLAAAAQPPAKVPRIGFLGRTWGGPNIEAFAQGLRELGYADYKDFVLVRRDAPGDEALLDGLAEELVRLKMDILVADSTPSALAAQNATKTIPIVAVVGDPVGSGLVASLARPGRNITGLSAMTAELGGKRLELLKEVLPKLTHVAVLWHWTLTAEAVGLKDIQTAAESLGLRLSSLGARTPSEYDGALAAARRQRAGAVLFFGADPLGHPAERHLLRLAARHRLPTMYDRREYAEAGGLMGYGVSFPGLWRRAATYVDKILKGHNPADLPVEQPTKFELVINLKTAKTLGLKIPQSVLVRADEVMQ